MFGFEVTLCIVSVVNAFASLIINANQELNISVIKAAANLP